MVSGFYFSGAVFLAKLSVFLNSNPLNRFSLHPGRTVMFCPDFLHSGTQHWSVYQCGCARLRRSELFGLLWANQFFGTIKKRTSSFSHGDPYEFGFRLRSYGSHSETEGISHGLKNSPPDCFSPCCAGPAFRFPHDSL